MDFFCVRLDRLRRRLRLHDNRLLSIIGRRRGIIPRTPTVPAGPPRLPLAARFLSGTACGVGLGLICCAIAAPVAGIFTLRGIGGGRLFDADFRFAARSRAVLILALIALALIGAVAAVLTALLRIAVIDVHDSEVVFRVLVHVLRGDPVAGGIRVAR